MLKFKGFIVAFTLFLLINPFVHGGSNGRNKNILVLFARVPSSPAYTAILGGIRDKLSDEYGDSFYLHTEYLELERFPAGEYPEVKFDLYNQKYRNVQLDLLICVGIGIVPTIRQYADEFLLNLPTVSIDLDFSAIGYITDLALNDQTTVIPLTIDAEKSIDVAISIFPDTKYLYFISGVSASDQMFYELTRQAVKKFAEDKQIRYILDVSMDEALSRLNDLPDSSLLFMPFFVTDDKQVTYFNPESARLFSNASRVPLFVYTEVGLGEGAFGGYVISFTKAGLIAGEAAIRILKGEDPSSIKFSPEDYYHYAFDWRQMQRWQVSRSRLPQDYTILNRENDFLDRFMWLIITGILFLILQTILIFRLIILNRKYKMMTVQLRETESKFRDLVREDRVLRIGQLTASLSHELNQPLTAILSTAQAGIRFIDSNNADPQLLREILQNIVEDDKRTAAILSSIRGMMKLEKREMEKTNLNDLIQEMVIIFNTEAVAQKLKLEMKLTDEPVFVKADPIQIQQVIHNLMSNALQAMGKVISDNKKITITEIKAGDEVVVSVRDYGHGIDERITPKIFIPFVTTKKEGLGIGLAISRSIIDDHRGRIWAENKPDGGAEFSFSLKILKDEK